MSELADLRQAVAEALPGLDRVIAWQAGDDPLRAVPLIIRKPEDVERLIVGPTCLPSPARSLHELRGKKVGLVVKGCDSRSVVQLLQEQILKREDLVLFGLPCRGCTDPERVRRAAGGAQVLAVALEGDQAVLATTAGEVRVPRQDVLEDRCLRCRHPNPLLADRLFGEPVETGPLPPDDYADLERFTRSLDTPGRFRFWQEQMHRCIRCYACRNACPLCFCRDHCVADAREPHWLSQEADAREKWMFQIIHALHLAGRCTECGACERACPVGIPVLLLKRQMARVVRDLFGYEAGIDPAATPPLTTFQVEEEGIQERKL